MTDAMQALFAKEEEATRLAAKTAGIPHEILHAMPAPLFRREGAGDALAWLHAKTGGAKPRTLELLILQADLQMLQANGRTLYGEVWLAAPEGMAPCYARALMGARSQAPQPEPFAPAAMQQLEKAVSRLKQDGLRPLQQAARGKAWKATPKGQPIPEVRLTLGMPGRLQVLERMARRGLLQIPDGELPKDWERHLRTLPQSPPA